MAILSVKNLNVEFLSEGKNVKAVNNVSFDIEEKDSIGIVGESGSGKSTLAMAILKLLPSNTKISGEVLYKDKNILPLGNKQLKNIRWKEVAVVFQKSMNSLSPVHKIGMQLVDVYKIHSKKATKEEARKKIMDLLLLVNLPTRVFSLYPHELSGGMMQRVSIALSLIQNPNLLILDESTTALDVVTERQILEELKLLEETLNITRIMITHDMSVVATSCKKVAVMYAGNIVEFGMVEDVLTDPKHPYTKGLINSFASASNKNKEIQGIPGTLPDLSKSTKGCIFADRCPISEEICFEKVPLQRSFAQGREVSCHMVGGDLK
ncbi:MAG TPA: ABC transporter ATP-binding protein [Aliicoccus persicus]|uniref:Nickel import system ATP-binding protein NikD n=1 Tax=Aliicoccus persicus TaxID=930138 RepID=A0A921DYA3_9STAP|nr:ABC transporter ATP-binding protein [Aliicoccus persicus]